ncbi:MAG: hypothetical protein ACR2HC_05135 [Thermoleophilaceae bacterium]
MGPGQSHAGITVPEGDPDAVRTMAHTFRGLSGSLDRSAAGFSALPTELSAWQGPASVAFASVANESRAAATAGSTAFARKALAADRLADQLERAQRDTKKAITDAKDAEQRIRQAKREIADARRRYQLATDRIAVAELVIAATDLIATAPTAAYAERDQAQRDADQAKDDEQRAGKALERAQHDLETAQRAGRRAEEHAQDAATTATATFNNLGSGIPQLAPLGIPATGITTNSANPLAGTPALVALRNLTPGGAGAGPTALRRPSGSSSGPTRPSGFDPLFGQDPLVTGAAGATAGSAGGRSLTGKLADALGIH